MSKSEELFGKSRELFPGGVSSPVRAFKAVGGTPPFIEKGEGCHIWDVDQNEYIDFVLSYGPHILGHSDPDVVRAICETAGKGISFGAPTEIELRLGEMIRAAVPLMERLRFVNSGTEATMSAIRVARGFTGRSVVVKFEGAYHGHVDSLLVKAGSGAATFGVPDSGGIPEELAKETIVLPYNNSQAVQDLFKKHGDSIACVIVEPIAGNMGVVVPDEEFLRELRTQTSLHGSVLIADEVMTGFRQTYGGVQILFSFEPDMTTLGKIIGGGLPIGAYGGSKEIMRHVAPEGSIYQAGTLSGNPLAMASGVATLQKLKTPALYSLLEEKSRLLAEGINGILKSSGIPARVNRMGSMMTLFFSTEPVFDWATASKCDTELFSYFFKECLREGIYLPPSQFEAFFLSTKHDDNIVKQAISKFQTALLKTKEWMEKGRPQPT
ncbi:MAG: glutamate-1-semialdehyde 2,1-aminomutase [Nitrospiraceae bacterium]|nr:glutamate-1-semialdehyde 2,1-aminomutase [Nitrospirota bacterium]MDA8060623.1 glutamate-1-semialdehyde 2,1-aminomutase [Nitrospiraceae bacterium]